MWDELRCLVNPNHQFGCRYVHSHRLETERPVPTVGLLGSRRTVTAIIWPHSARDLTSRFDTFPLPSSPLCATFSLRPAPNWAFFFVCFFYFILKIARNVDYADCL